MQTWRDFIPSLFVPPQEVSQQQRKSNASSAGLSSDTLAALVDNATLRPSSIGQDPELVHRLSLFLQHSLAEDPVMQQTVPDHVLQDWSALKRQLARTNQVEERDTQRYCCLCLDFVLSILHEIRPATAATCRLREQSTVNLSALGIMPDVIIDGNNKTGRSIHFLLEVKTNAVLRNHLGAIDSLNVNLDWQNNKIASQAYCSSQPITMITKLVAFMQRQELPFAFICDGTRYMVLQTCTINDECLVAVSSMNPFGSAYPPFVPIVLASILATVGDQSTLPSMLSIPAALGTRLGALSPIQHPDESRRQHVEQIGVKPRLPS